MCPISYLSFFRLKISSTLSNFYFGTNSFLYHTVCLHYYRHALVVSHGAFLVFLRNYVACIMLRMTLQNLDPKPTSLQHYSWLTLEPPSWSFLSMLKEGTFYYTCPRNLCKFCCTSSIAWCDWSTLCMIASTYSNSVGHFKNSSNELITSRSTLSMTNIACSLTNRASS